MNHRIILADGRTALLPNGQAAIQGEGGCPTCCGGGGGGPSGPCTCFPIDHPGVRCGIPLQGQGNDPWAVTVAGSVTYAESVIDTTFGIIRSDVPTQTRSINRTRLYTSCGELLSVPLSPEPTITFNQNAPAGVGRYTTPTLRLRALVANIEDGQAIGWNVPVGDQSMWAANGPYQYEPNDQNAFSMEALSRFVDRGLLLNGGGNFTGAEDKFSALWVANESNAIAQLFFASTKSPAELGADFDNFTSSASSTLDHSRAGCAYTLTRTVSASYTGRRGVSQVIEYAVAFSANYTITAQLVSCQDVGGLLNGTTDPRVVEAAERLLRQCRNCGDR